LLDCAVHFQKEYDSVRLRALLPPSLDMFTELGDTAKAQTLAEAWLTLYVWKDPAWFQTVMVAVTPGGIVPRSQVTWFPLKVQLPMVVATGDVQVPCPELTIAKLEGS